MEEMLRAIFMNGFNNALKITPSHISIISELNLKSKNIKTIIVGGEELTFNHLKSLKEIAPEALIYNEYGPTEATVGCVIYQCKGTELKIPIGKPINNTSTFILNDNLCLCPFGVQGEIYISGSSVSQRYLNRPDLTEEHFIQSPFNNEEKLYKTGDIGKLNNNNEIEFFGRNDNQIKLRGYRVELNEIESILNLLENVKQSVVLVKQVNGYDNLVAYICSDLKLNDKEIMRALSRSLPDYMIPVFYVYMSKLPINSNGKIDKTELPEFLQGTAEYIAPRNDTEMMVLKIWEKVLDKDNISMTDNFFSLGGDSIKAIQIASRLYEEGYKMDLEQLFQNSTIEELSTVITLLENFPDQNPVTGIIPLTPIQREFFSWTNIDRHHFNQAILLNLHININQDVLKQVLNRIVEQHDALRIVFQKTKEDIIQEGISFRQINLNIFDLTGMDLEEQAEIIRSESDSLQKSFTFSGEPLIKFILFKSDIGDKLFIVVHHLVIDAVSWRIFLDDLDSLLEQVNNCQEISLSLKTSSYRDWANELIVYSKGKNFLKEVKYWQSVASSASINDLPFDNFKGANLIRNISSTNFLLDAESTNALLTSTNKTYNTKIDDILLTALGLAFYRTFGMAEILVAMENHGRENINSNLNINRTIGWFTSIYPIRISTKYPDDLSKQIKNIKDDMHRVPFNGIGYGILKHYGNQEISESISLSPHVSFNYLGAFDNILKHKKNISVCMDDIGFSESIDRNRTYSIDVVGILLQKELKLTFFYSNEQFNNGTIERLQQNFKKSLLDIIFFCEQQETELTSSDFTYKLLDNEILDNFFE
jgi:non-ribosomal peptide synthase protein (TIGR01720 family)